LAERAGISADAVGALERGFRKAPYRDTVERLARGLRLSADAEAALHAAVRRARSGGATSPLAGPAFAARDAPKHNLPRQLTSFVGRDDVVAELDALVEASPLVTIVGTGGIGKTRTAVETGFRMLERRHDGVWLVELASLKSGERIVPAIADVLGVQETAARPLLETLIARLRDRRLLLILDNCEHLIAEAADTARTLLRECPNIGILATSREPLTVGGERVYRLPSLSFPSEGAAVEREADEYPAVALFLERARAARGAFALAAGDAAAGAEICRRLDGVPLAIELAAARVRTLSIKELARDLDHCFSVLTGGDRTTLPRQRTMRALIDWSYDLLDPFERTLFARLAIFPTDFSLTAAAATCAGDGLEDDLFDLVLSLVDKSLLIARTHEDGETRYRMTEATRQYALEKLIASAEREDVARRHALTFLDIAERLERAWYDDPDDAWTLRAERDLDDFRAALDWAAARDGDTQIFLRLVAALARVWYAMQPVEGQRWISAALGRAASTGGDDLVARLRLAEAELAEGRAQFATALESARLARSTYASLGDVLGEARATHVAGSALVAMGSFAEGERLLHEALNQARALESARLVAMTLSALGGAHNRRGDSAEAKELYAEALAYHRRHGFNRQAASIEGNLAEVEFGLGNVEAALEHADAAYAGHVAMRNRRAAAIDLFNMSAYLIAVGLFDEARTTAFEALETARELQARMFGLWSLQHVAAVAALRPLGDGEGPAKRERAALLLGYVDARLAQGGGVREYTERQEYDRVIRALTDDLGSARLRELLARGAGWSEERALDEAATL
jgi:predicted ATPase